MTINTEKTQRDTIIWLKIHQAYNLLHNKTQAKVYDD